ncbi:hypothetical protein EV382_5535 [Micromonospora violae]|uniref:Uncharacterized protein n=1 Tax=Micromonospora violae TaxID=1278207 RepID=A0A4V2FQ17_9ACTN|nr:hypothetical protein [Micromonospora violae]RZT82230.1 hypothetical protein EV382_5535 [Micromonospora violae]
MGTGMKKSSLYGLVVALILTVTVGIGGAAAHRDNAASTGRSVTAEQQKPKSAPSPSYLDCAAC